VSIRAVIFDFGGVLVRMIDDRPCRELAARLGVPLSRLDDLVFFSQTAREASRGVIQASQHWRAVGQALGISQEEMPRFLEKYWSADDVNWKLLDFIRSLRPQYKVGLLSNAWDDLRQTIHERWNIDSLFDEMIISAEVHLVKPDPRIFHLTIERLQVHPSEAVFVDDMAENVEAAVKEGLVAIQYLDLDQTLSELKRILVSI
jgi:epoxide hydrolase-like predicted phosphatase